MAVEQTDRQMERQKSIWRDGQTFHLHTVFILSQIQSPFRQSQTLLIDLQPHTS